MNLNWIMRKGSRTTGWEVFSKLVRIAMGAGIDLTPTDPYADLRQGDGWR